MFGNVLNNSQLTQLRSSGQITIDPFKSTDLKLAHYPLRPGMVLWAGPVGSNNKRSLQPRHSFENDSEYHFEPNEYAIIEIDEIISINTDGIFGHFIPSSLLVESGFSLTAGKIDPKYGNLNGKKQKIIFGMKNLKSETNIIRANDVIAHVYFVDLRGLNNLPAKFSSEEFEAFIRRFAHYKSDYDDGPKYD